MMHAQTPKSQQGVMLIEALVAILIFTLGIVAVMGLQANSIAQVTPGEVPHRRELPRQPDHREDVGGPGEPPELHRGGLRRPRRLGHARRLHAALRGRHHRGRGQRGHRDRPVAAAERPRDPQLPRACANINGERLTAMTRNPRASLLRHAGFTLVEIMIGLLIGVIGIVVIMQVFAVSEGFKRTATSGTDAQVNGSVALYLLQRDIRLAGYGLNTFVSAGLHLDRRVEQRHRDQQQHAPGARSRSTRRASRRATRTPTRSSSPTAIPTTSWRGVQADQLASVHRSLQPDPEPRRLPRRRPGDRRAARRRARRDDELRAARAHRRAAAPTAAAARPRPAASLNHGTATLQERQRRLRHRHRRPTTAPAASPTRAAAAVPQAHPGQRGPRSTTSAGRRRSRSTPCAAATSRSCDMVNADCTQRRQLHGAGERHREPARDLRPGLRRRAAPGLDDAGRRHARPLEPRRAREHERRLAHARGGPRDHLPQRPEGKARHRRPRATRRPMPRARTAASRRTGSSPTRRSRRARSPARRSTCRRCRPTGSATGTSSSRRACRCAT